VTLLCGSTVTANVSSHDRVKPRLLAPSDPFLIHVGVSTADGSSIKAGWCKLKPVLKVHASSPRTALVHPTYTSQTHLVHSSYTPHTPLIHLLYTPHTPLVHPLYTPRTPLIHPPYTPYTPFIHTTSCFYIFADSFDVRPSDTAAKQDKYKQVEEFLRLVDQAVSDAQTGQHMRVPAAQTPLRLVDLGRGLHSSTFQLNLSRFLSLTPPTYTEYPTKRAYIELKSVRG
jgi:hypothetical protein